MPVLLIASFNKQFSPELFSNSVQLILISIFVYTGLIILAWLWWKFFKIPQEELRFILIFGNFHTACCDLAGYSTYEGNRQKIWFPNQLKYLL
jgi:predicted permease